MPVRAYVRYGKIVWRFLLACSLLHASPAFPQSTTAAQLPEGTLSGAVLDASTSAPLPAATLVLKPESRAALPSPGAGAGSFLRETRAERSSTDGTYRFTDIPPGRYQLRISRAGYRSVVVSIELRGSAESRVSIGLQMEPIALAAVEVTAPLDEPFRHNARLESPSEDGRIRAARRRQEAHLSSDVRGLTHGDLVEAVTLAETDIFRALQRLPGVTTRDSYSADFWLRGAPWSQTRVYFDGVPVFHPLHGGGLLSGVNPDGLSGAVLYPGVQPSSLGSGGSGAVELSSRRGGGTGGLRGGAELSVASARLTLDQRTADGRMAWMLAGRRSYVDWLTRAIEEADHWAYSFSDLTGRADLQIDSTRALQASGFLARNASADRSPEQPYNRGRWGNAVGRISYSSSLGQLRVQHTLGVSRYSSIVRKPTGDTANLEALGDNVVGETDDRLIHASLSAEVKPRDAAERWSLGYQLVRERNRYLGPPPAYHRSAGDERLDMESTLLRGALWGRSRWQAGERLSVESAMRLEVAPRVGNAGAVRVAPRLSARFRPTPGTSLTAALGRGYQYVQGLAPVGLTVLNDSPASELWLLGGETTPALRADVATLGGEAWFGDNWLASANGYLRHSTGVALPDPTPGLRAGSGPLFVTGESQARGIELSLRRLAGRWTTSAAYSYLDAETEAVGLRFSSPTARTHTLNASAMVRAWASLRLGAAYTAASGTPFTRTYLPTRYWTIHAECAQDPECARSHTVFGAPYAARTPRYARLDLLVDWFHQFRSWELATYLQLHNALGRRNPVAYGGTFDDCPGRDFYACSEADYVQRDHFDQDLPLVPVIGFRARF